MMKVDGDDDDFLMMVMIMMMMMMMISMLVMMNVRCAPVGERERLKLQIEGTEKSTRPATDDDDDDCVDENDDDDDDDGSDYGEKKGTMRRKVQSHLWKR